MSSAIQLVACARKGNYAELSGCMISIEHQKRACTHKRVDRVYITKNAGRVTEIEECMFVLLP